MSRLLATDMRTFFWAIGLEIEGSVIRMRSRGRYIFSTRNKDTKKNILRHTRNDVGYSSRLG